MNKVIKEKNGKSLGSKKIINNHLMTDFDSLLQYASMLQNKSFTQNHIPIFQVVNYHLF